MIATAVRRSGFTLLEVLLASVIAIMLMAALYSALEVTLTRTQINREQIDASDLSRAVVNRLTADLSSGVGPLPPKSGGSPADTSGSGAGGGGGSSSSMSSSGSTSGSGSGSGAGGSTTTSTASTTTTSTTGTSGSAGASGTTTSTDGTATDIPFAAGVIGSANQLTVFSTRVPVGLTDPDAVASPDILRPADVRRVTYYLGTQGGLCRQERPWATADGVRNSSDPDFSAEETDLIAPEVADISFEYYDAGSGSWMTDWDGSQTDTDGVSLIGPPRAIRVTLTLNVPGHSGTTQKQVQHVIAVRSAVGTYTPPTDDGTGTTGN